MIHWSYLIFGLLQLFVFDPDGSLAGGQLNSNLLGEGFSFIEILKEFVSLNDSLIELFFELGILKLLHPLVFPLKLFFSFDGGYLLPLDLYLLEFFLDSSHLLFSIPFQLVELGCF